MAGEQDPLSTWTAAWREGRFLDPGKLVSTSSQLRDLQVHIRRWLQKQIKQLPRATACADMRVHNRYRLERVLGLGGQGEVWQATDEYEQTRVAIRLIVADSYRAFRTQVQAIAWIKHPCILPILHYGSTGIHCFCVQPYVAYSLPEYIRQHGTHGRLSVAEATSILIRLAPAVRHLHSRCWMHRDIKPDNILVDGNGEAFLTDLWIAGPLKKFIQQRKAGSGSLAYQAPEQVNRDHDKLAFATDVYGLIATYHYMLTGHPPFEASTRDEMEETILERPPEPWRWNPSLPKMAAQLIEKGLAKGPNDRFHTVDELIEEAVAVLPIWNRPVILLGTRPRRAAAFVTAALVASMLSIFVGLAILSPRSGAIPPAIALHAAGDVQPVIFEWTLMNQPLALAGAIQGPRVHELRDGIDRFLKTGSLDPDLELSEASEMSLGSRTFRVRLLSGDSNTVAWIAICSPEDSRHISEQARIFLASR